MVSPGRAVRVGGNGRVKSYVVVHHTQLHPLPHSLPYSRSDWQMAGVAFATHAQSIKQTTPEHQSTLAPTSGASSSVVLGVGTRTLGAPYSMHDSILLRRMLLGLRLRAWMWRCRTRKSNSTAVSAPAQPEHGTGW